MRKLTFEITPEFDGVKVGNYLKRVHGFSTKVLKKLKASPTGITCNGNHVRTIDPLKTGDLLAVEIEDNPQPYAISDIPVDILYEDEDIVVFDKPVGMPVHPAKTHKENTLANAFASIYTKRGEQRTFRIINRMDQDTSGAVVVAKNAHAATKLVGNNSREHVVYKQYIALCCGIIPYDAGVIDASLGRLGDDYINRVVTTEGQFARTEFHVLERGAGYTLVRCLLHTGRTHQIRVHMSWLGYPLAGDDLYGTDRTIIGRQALHCAQVSFLHPVTNMQTIVEAPLPPDIREALKRCNITALEKSDGE